MRPIAQGRPGTQVVPDGFAAANDAAATGTMTAVVNLRVPGTGKSWDEATQRTVYTPNTPYATGVPAVITAQLAQGQATDAAGEIVHAVGYFVGLPYDQDQVEPDHYLDVTGCPEDPSLVGRTLTVVDVVRGSLRVQRDLFCTLNDD